MIYNFYAEPLDKDKLIIVTSNPSIHQLRHILLYNNLLDSYKIINERLEKDCLVEDHHYYKNLMINWIKPNLVGWSDDDSLPFSFLYNADEFIKEMIGFIGKPFSKTEFIKKLNSNKKFKCAVDNIFGEIVIDDEDTNYIEVYFDRDDWHLNSITCKDIKTVTIKNSAIN